MRIGLGVLIAGLCLVAGSTMAEPVGLTVWSGEGSAGEGGHIGPGLAHLSVMHFPNGRTVYTTMGPGTLYGFGGAPPARHGRTYSFHVDQVYVGKDGYPADGRCEVKLRADSTLRSFGCGAAAQGGPGLSIGFEANRTPPDFKSFDSARPIPLSKGGRSGGHGG